MSVVSNLCDFAMANSIGIGLNPAGRHSDLTVRIISSNSGASSAVLSSDGSDGTSKDYSNDGDDAMRQRGKYSFKTISKAALALEVALVFQDDSNCSDVFTVVGVCDDTFEWQSLCC